GAGGARARRHRDRCRRRHPAAGLRTALCGRRCCHLRARLGHLRVGIEDPRRACRPRAESRVTTGKPTGSALLNASASAPLLPQGPARLTVADYVDGVLGCKRAILSRAITLIESHRPDHEEMAHELVNRLLPHTGGSIRVGLTGVPGAGKSTLIEALGC